MKTINFDQFALVSVIGLGIGSVTAIVQVFNQALQFLN